MAEGDGDEHYPAEGDQDEAELGFVGVLDGEDEVDYSGDGDDEGDEADRHTPGSGSTDPMPKPVPKPKAKVGTTSSTAVGLRMADTNILNKLTERRRELEQKLEEERARGAEADPGEISKLSLMISQVEDQIKRAKELKASRNKRVSARLKADLDAGHNPRLAVQKEKSRQRAAKHRAGMRAEQARKRLAREEAVEKRFNVPEKARKQDEYPLIPGAGSKIAAPPSRCEKAMMKGKEEDRESSGDELEKPKERGWTPKSRRLTPEGRVSKAKREKRRRAGRKAERQQEGGEECEDEGDGAEPVRPTPEPKTPPRSPKRMPKRKGKGKAAKPVEDEEMEEIFIEEDEEPAPEPKVKTMPKKPAAKAKGSMSPPEPEGPPPKDANLTEVVFTFKDGSGAVVRRMFPMLTERQKSRVQKALATAPWRESQLKPRSEGKVGRQTRPAVDRRSQLFQRTVSYLKGTRLFVPTSRVRRKGLMKQFKAAPRFRERVGISRSCLARFRAALPGKPWSEGFLMMRATVVPAKAGARRPSSRRTCIIRRERLRWPRRRPLRSSPRMRTITSSLVMIQTAILGTGHCERGQRAHLVVGKAQRKPWCTPLRTPMVVPRRRPPCRLSWTVAPATM